MCIYTLLNDTRLQILFIFLKYQKIDRIFVEYYSFIRLFLGLTFFHESIRIFEKFSPRRVESNIFRKGLIRGRVESSNCGFAHLQALLNNY